MPEDPTFKIPRDVIEPIIQAKVSAAIIEALGNQEWLVKNCIAKALDEKVNDNGGKAESYYADRSPTFLQWALRACVQTSIKKILEEEMAKHKEVIADGLRKEILRKSSPFMKQLIEGMTSSIISAASNNYKLTVEVKERG
jgi:hypothetical protein